VYGRLALTLAIPIGVLLLAQIPLPGVDIGAFEQLWGLAGESDRALVGILALELNPVLSAALLVELFALAIPRWRDWRLGGYPERAGLWMRVALVAVVLVLVQSFFMVRWLQSTTRAYAFIPGLVAEGPLVAVAQMLSLTGGTFLLFWLTRVIGTLGLANGFSVMIVAFTFAPTVGATVSSARERFEAGDRILLPLLLAAVAVAAVTRLAGGRPLRLRASTAGAVQLPTPSSGLQPVLTAFSLLQLPASLKKTGIDLLPASFESQVWLRRGVEAALAAAFCLLLTWLFNRPRAVIETLRRAGASETAPLRDPVRAAVAHGLAWSVAVCWGLLGVEWFCQDAQLAVGVVNLVVIACVVMDVVDELRFRRRNGALARVWPVHRLYVLPVMLRALDVAAIPAFPRGRRHRTLWNFLTPYVPIEIFVPVEEATRAEAILRPLSGAPAEIPEASPDEVAPDPSPPATI
jgi:hypothetical protein